ncbi:MAG: hypothetical protein R2860_10760 [Desulfobacterales bacterium]
MARVVMVSAHRPRRPINTIEMMEKMARGMPENRCGDNGHHSDNIEADGPHSARRQNRSTSALWAI